jgi:hypothetical protein
MYTLLHWDAVSCWHRAAATVADCVAKVRVGDDVHRLPQVVLLVGRDARRRARSRRAALLLPRVEDILGQRVTDADADVTVTVAVTMTVGPHATSAAVTVSWTDRGARGRAGASGGFVVAGLAALDAVRGDVHQVQRRKHSRLAVQRR